MQGLFVALDSGRAGGDLVCERDGSEDHVVERAAIERDDRARFAAGEHARLDELEHGRVETHPFVRLTLLAERRHRLVETRRATERCGPCISMWNSRRLWRRTWILLRRMQALRNRL